MPDIGTGIGPRLQRGIAADRRAMRGSRSAGRSPGSADASRASTIVGLPRTAHDTPMFPAASGAFRLAIVLTVYAIGAADPRDGPHPGGRSISRDCSWPRPCSHSRRRPPLRPPRLLSVDTRTIHAGMPFTLTLSATGFRGAPGAGAAGTRRRRVYGDLPRRQPQRLHADHDHQRAEHRAARRHLRLPVAGAGPPPPARIACRRCASSRVTSPRAPRPRPSRPTWFRIPRT